MAGSISPRRRTIRSAVDGRTYRDGDQRSASQLALQSGGRPRRIDLCGGFAATRDVVVPARRREHIADKIAPPRPHTIEVTTPRERSTAEIVNLIGGRQGDGHG